MTTNSHIQSLSQDIIQCFQCMEPNVAVTNAFISVHFNLDERKLISHLLLQELVNDKKLYRLCRNEQFYYDSSHSKTSVSTICGTLHVYGTMTARTKYLYALGKTQESVYAENQYYIKHANWADGVDIESLLNQYSMALCSTEPLEVETMQCWD